MTQINQIQAGSANASQFIRLAQGYDASIADGGTGVFAAGIFSVLAPITAHAGGGRQISGPSVITQNICIAPIGTVATAGDSITLPDAIPGSVIFILVPPGLNNFIMWSLGGSDTIDGIDSGTQGGATGYTVTTFGSPKGVTLVMSCAIATQWFGFGAFN